MAILAIVQFEVHSYQDGRWTLQSRYPGDERKQAIADAAATEEMTRRPCKVVKETYYPQENRSDSVTVYVSPRAKEMIERLKKPAQGHKGELGAVRAAKGLEARTVTGSAARGPQRSLAPQAADLFWRTVIAIGLSLGSATVVTAMMSWLLSRMVSFGVTMDAGAISSILTLTYVGVFLLGMLSLFRFGAPIKRLIAMLWSSNPAVASAQPPTRETIQAMALHLRPKRKKVSFEQERETTDMKRLRGDPDQVAPIDLNAGDPPGVVPGMPDTLTNPPQPLEPLEAEKNGKKKKQAQKQPEPAKAEPPKAEPAKAEPKQQTPAQTPPAVLADETPVPQPAALDEETARATIAATYEAEPEPAFSASISNLHRALAMRFATEVMLPQIASAPDDPVTRRGAALFMAGAMAHLAAVSGLGAAGEMALTMAALPATLPRHAVNAFMTHYAAHVAISSNVALMTRGRQAMARFLAGQSNDNVLIESLSTWRVPPPTFFTPKPSAASELDAELPSDFYLMTELNSDDGVRMDEHNQIVRESLEVTDGREIKHTGRGILARFQRADEAVQAALMIGRKLAAAPALAEVDYATALVAGYGTIDDPLHSANATKTAQSMLDAAPRGAIIAQPAVHDHAQASQSALSIDPFPPTWLKISERSPDAAPAPPADETTKQVETVA